MSQTFCINARHAFERLLEIAEIQNVAAWPRMPVLPWNWELRGRPRDQV